MGEAALEVAAPEGLGLLGRADGDEVDEALVGPVGLLVVLGRRLPALGSPGPLRGGASSVREEPTVDGVADVPLQRPDRLLVRLAFRDASVEVGATV